VLNVYFDLVI
jgi:hypothetical protein